jgi:hypothetical protein
MIHVMAGDAAVDEAREFHHGSAAVYIFDTLTAPAATWFRHSN